MLGDFFRERLERPFCLTFQYKILVNNVSLQDFYDVLTKISKYYLWIREILRIMDAG